MTNIKLNSYKGNTLLHNYNRGYGVDNIYDIYAHPSSAKYRAFEYCRNEYYKNNGSGGLRCTGSNSCFFTIAYMTGVGDLITHTAKNDYIVKAAIDIE